MKKVEFATHIGGIPSIVVAHIRPDEGDNWHTPYIPEHVEDMEVLNMRGRPCKWRESRMTAKERERIENEALEAAWRQEEYV